MRRILAFATAFISVLLMAGCGGGSRPAAPTDVAAAAHDSSAVITWTMDPGVDYWVWVAPGTTLDWRHCTDSPFCQIHRAVTSPFLVLGLTNGVTYSVVVNGNSGSGPVGEPSAPVPFVPILVGTNWNVGTPLASTLLGVGFTPTTGLAGGAFVAAGVGGSLYSSANATTWTTSNSNVATNLNAVLFGDAKFVVAGDAGVILTSSDAVLWTLVTSGTANNLYALALNGTSMVAVGANGTILTSGDGITWTPRNSGTINDLYGVTFANGIYVAVGAKGTLLTSSNGVDWQAQAVQTSLDLKSVAYGLGVTTFVAVGTAGTLVTSTDGVNWITRTPIAANSLSAVVYGTQFIAVGTGGGIFTSVDGIAWLPAVSGTTSDLHAVAFSAGVISTVLEIGYVAVGAGGVNLTAF